MTTSEREEGLWGQPLSSRTAAGALPGPGSLDAAVGITLLRFVRMSSNNKGGHANPLSTYRSKQQRQVCVSSLQGAKLIFSHKIIPSNSDTCACHPYNRGIANRLARNRSEQLRHMCVPGTPDPFPGNLPGPPPKHRGGGGGRCESAKPKSNDEMDSNFGPFGAKVRVHLIA